MSKSIATHPVVKTLVERLNLTEHPEGGFYRRFYESQDVVDVMRHGQLKPRKTGTAIYYLLQSGDFSAWHRIQSDETWHHHAGSVGRVYTLDPETALIETHLFGNPLENEGIEPCVTVRKGLWFCADVVEPDGYMLCSCTVAPGFDFADFEMADRQALLAEFPQHHDMLVQYTR